LQKGFSEKLYKKPEGVKGGKKGLKERGEGVEETKSAERGGGVVFFF